MHQVQYVVNVCYRCQVCLTGPTNANGDAAGASQSAKADEIQILGKYLTINICYAGKLICLGLILFNVSARLE